jgi:hypothetical protein
MSGLPDLSTTPSVINSSDEGPEELDASSEEFSKIRQGYEEEGKADDGVDNGQSFTCRCFWINVAVTCK